MEDRFDHGRRSFLARAGTVVAAGTATLAGCLGGSEPDTGEPFLDPEPDYRGWFDGVSNYKGTRDRRGQSETAVEVGVTANNGAYGFGPAAIAISPGTTVTWKWTGRGGPHNVVADQGTFDSGKPIQSSTETFEYAFDSPGVFKYVCTPHRHAGMRGAVFVALEG